MTSSSAAITSGMRLYLISKNYNQPFADLVPAVLCNAFKLHLNILEEGRNGSIRQVSVLPTGEVPHSTVRLHKQGLHYNSLIPIQPTHLSATADIKHTQPSSALCATSAATPSRSNAIICYSKDDLDRLSCHYSVARSTRKILIKYDLWKPRRKEDSCLEQRPVSVHISNRLLSPRDADDRGSVSNNCNSRRKSTIRENLIHIKRSVISEAGLPHKHKSRQWTEANPSEPMLATLSRHKTQGCVTAGLVNAKAQ